MPRLYCVKHGKEHRDRVIGNDAIYRGEGESVLIVAGTLITGGWLCDECNRPLRRGQAAHLVTSFPRWITESMWLYDFVYERNYFAMNGTEEIAVYGAPWPGGDAAAMLDLAGEL